MDLVPLEDAVERIDAKTPIGSVLRSREWEDVPLALRERAQFSAGVTSARLLQAIQDRLSGEVNLRREQLAEGGAAMFDRSSFIDAIREIGRSEGLTPSEPGERGTLRDITSIPRLGMIYDMQNQMATGFARWKMDQSQGAMLLYPAWRLVRERDSKAPRDWRARWAEAGAAVGFEGAVESPMVALKTSPIWAALSRFGTPWPPFDYNSGMGVEDVDRDEAVGLGLLKEDEIPEAQGEERFNDGLEASATGLTPELKDVLREHFGSQIRVEKDKVSWNSDSVSSNEQRLKARQREARRIGSDLGEGLGVGRGVSEAEVGGGSVSSGGGASAMGGQDSAAAGINPFTLKQAVAQASSVAVGQKPLYHEFYLTEREAASVADALRTHLPPGVEVRVDGNQVYAWRPDRVNKSFEQISKELEEGRGGDLLGYGTKSLGDRNTVLVEILNDKGSLVAGFRAPADQAELWAKAREQDWTEATGRKHRYRIKG